MAAEAESKLLQLRDAGVGRGAAEAARSLVAAKAPVGRLEDATQVLIEMAKRFDASGDKANYAEALLACAELHSAKHETEKALKALNKMPSLAELGAAGRELSPHYLKLMVSVALSKEDASKAKSAASELLASAQQSGDKIRQAEAWSALASAGALQARDEDGAVSVAEEAMQAADKALALYQDSGDLQGQAAALVAAARARLAITRPNEGRTKAEDALELARQLGQPKAVVSALEVLIQAQAMSGTPMEGLRAANKELENARQSGNKVAEAELLDMLAHTHATLRNPVSAMSYARQALNLHYQSGDRSAQGWSLHTVAEMQRAQGQMQEATVTVKEAQVAFQAASDRFGQEQALWTLSLLMAARGQIDKAPARKDVKQALRKFTRAIQDKSADDFKEATDALEKCRELVIDGELFEHIMSVVSADDTLKAFLKEQGWDLDAPPEGVPKYEGTDIYAYGHKAFYLQTLMTGMGFGPQFRAVHPYRKGDPKKMPNGHLDCCAMSASQLAETEDWQQQTQFRHGIMDSGLQVGSVMGFP